ncbi:MAG: Xaa-Pro peptidase family protein [Pseudomonadota bacterium]
MEPGEAPASLFIPSSEIENRLRSLQDLMTQDGLDGILISQNVDLFYFSGTMQPGYLYVPSQEEPVFLAKKNIGRALEESPLTNIIPIASPKEIPSVLAERDLPRPQILGLEMDVLPANSYLHLRSIFNEARIQDASIVLRKCRLFKSPWEIENLTRAARMMTRMVQEVPKILRPGITEIELAGRLEAFLRTEGHQGYIRTRGYNQEVFYGHVLSGVEGAQASYIDSPSGGMGVGPAFSQGAGLKTIRAGEPICIDYVGCYNGYLVDQTRMFSLGEPPPAVKEAYLAVIRIQESLKLKAQPGIPCEQIYFWALEEAKRSGYKNRFMGQALAQAPYIGHGIGLELDELPIFGKNFNWPLEAGMVFALEPKIILPEYGLVGIENTYLMTKTGLKPITTAPEDFRVI